MVRLEKALVARGDAAMLGPVTLELGPKGVTVLMGPNGAGKTTLLKLLHGLERPRSGAVVWDGVAPDEQAFVFQRPVLLRRSARENLLLPLKLRGLPGDGAEIALELELTDLLDQHAPRLSGGEAQRLALGRALITDPKVIFLDEPAANLDAPTVRAMETLVAQRAAEGLRLFMSTHSASQAKRLASDILWVENGSVRGPFTPEDFFNSPPEAAQAFLETQT
ncbi:MAG: ATP-binding cassette domain-containing protein [Rhodobacteraceae bacterium]|nr:ATP-binding cassette domain-containing protein [Paracoccaceae bacterium]